MDTQVALTHSARLLVYITVSEFQITINPVSNGGGECDGNEEWTRNPAPRLAFQQEVKTAPPGFPFLMSYFGASWLQFLIFCFIIRHGLLLPLHLKFIPIFELFFSLLGVALSVPYIWRAR